MFTEKLFLFHKEIENDVRCLFWLSTEWKMNTVKNQENTHRKVVVVVNDQQRKAENIQFVRVEMV